MDKKELQLESQKIRESYARYQMEKKRKKLGKKVDVTIDFQKDENEEVNEMALASYNLAKAKMKSEIFFCNNKYFTVNIINNGFDYELAVNNVEKLMKSVLTVDAFKSAVAFIAEHRTLKKMPYLITSSHVFESDGKIREELKDSKDLIADIQKPFASLDKETARIDMFPGLPNIEDSTEEEIQDYELLLSLIVGKKNTPLLLRYLAQVVLENRSNRSGRATLLLYGVRGSGKSFFVQHILSSLLPNNVTSLPSNFRQFNGYLQKKVVFRDENEAEEISPLSLYRFAKELSGATQMTINKKGVEVYSTPVSTFLVIMSNEKPLSIRDMPTNEFNNQWLAFECDNILNMDKKYEALLARRGTDLSLFLKKMSGAFIAQRLIPIYKDSAKRFFNTRYGFPIPLSKQVMDLADNSSNSYDIIADTLLETLMSATIRERESMLRYQPESTRMLAHWQAFEDSQFISNNLVAAVIAVKKLDLSVKRFSTFLSRHKLTKKELRKTISGAIVRGRIFNQDKYQADLEKEEALAKSMRIKDVIYNDLDIFN